MIWTWLCWIGRHDWTPVFQHQVDAEGHLRSLVRCYRVRVSGHVCLAERYTDTSRIVRRGGQL